MAPALSMQFLPAGNSPRNRMRNTCLIFFYRLSGNIFGSFLCILVIWKGLGLSLREWMGFFGFLKTFWKYFLKIQEKINLAKWRASNWGDDNTSCFAKILICVHRHPKLDTSSTKNLDGHIWDHKSCAKVFTIQHMHSDAATLCIRRIALVLARVGGSCILD